MRCSCFTPEPWGCPQQLHVCWDSAAALQVGHGGEAELVILLPTLCASPADCQHWQLLDYVNPFQTLKGTSCRSRIHFLKAIRVVQAARLPL